MLVANLHSPSLDPVTGKLVAPAPWTASKYSSASSLLSYESLTLLHSFSRTLDSHPQDQVGRLDDSEDRRRFRWKSCHCRCSNFSKLDTLGNRSRLVRFETTITTDRTHGRSLTLLYCFTRANEGICFVSFVWNIVFRILQVIVSLAIYLPLRLAKTPCSILQLSMTALVASTISIAIAGLSASKS